MKTFATGLLCFLLFILLLAFGMVFTVNQIALNPGFTIRVINDIDFSETTRNVFEEQRLQYPGEELPPEVVDAIVETVDEIEPVLKENVEIAVRDMFDYLLGKTNAPDLKETLSDSFLNPEFLDSLLEKIDLSLLVNTLVEEQAPATGEAGDIVLESILTAIEKLEPAVKTQLVTASGPVFAYILGQSPDINLKNVLRQNILNREFMTEMINAWDISTIANDLIHDQLDVVLPDNITLTDGEIEQIIKVLEPEIKKGLIAVADPVADYLSGIRSNFSVTVSLDPVLPTVKQVVKQAYIRQLPPGLAGATQVQIDTAYEVYWLLARTFIPANIDINSNMLAEDLSLTINDMLVSARNGLTEARNSINQANNDIEQALAEIKPYINLFRLLFWSLLILILLVVGGVILIHHSVKGITRDLGITFTVYGVIEIIGVLILRNIIGGPAFIRSFSAGDIPDFVIDIISPIIQRMTQPLFIFSVVCLIIGIVLLVTYYVYPKMRKPAADNQSTPANS